MRFKKKTRLILSVSAMLLALAAIGIMITESVVLPGYDNGETVPVWLGMLFTTLEELFLAGAAFLLLLIAESGYYLKPRFGGIMGILLILGGLAVSAANFPFATLASGELTFVNTEYFPLYVLLCLSVGLFEEIAFRGILLQELIKRVPKKKAGLFLAIIISGAAFALTHLLNLAAGAGVGQTFYQVGYSFLVGCMCGVAMLATGSVVWPVVIHTTFNFGGLLGHAGLADGIPWNNSGMIVMAVVSVVVFLFYVLYFVLDRRIVLKAFNR